MYEAENGYAMEIHRSYKKVYQQDACLMLGLSNDCNYNSTKNCVQDTGHERSVRAPYLTDGILHRIG